MPGIRIGRAALLAFAAVGVGAAGCGGTVETGRGGTGDGTGATTSRGGAPVMNGGGGDFPVVFYGAPSPPDAGSRSTGGGTGAGGVPGAGGAVNAGGQGGALGSGGVATPDGGPQSSAGGRHGIPIYGAPPVPSQHSTAFAFYVAPRKELGIAEDEDEDEG